MLGLFSMSPEGFASKRGSFGRNRVVVPPNEEVSGFCESAAFRIY